MLWCGIDDLLCAHLRKCALMKLVRLRSRANATFVLDRGGRATRDIRGTFIGTLSLRFAGVGHLRTLCFGGGEGGSKFLKKSKCPGTLILNEP